MKTFFLYSESTKPKYITPNRGGRLADQYRILLVEQEQILRTTFCLLLQKAGYKVVQSDMIQAAFLQHHKHPFHLIIIRQGEFSQEDLAQTMQSLGSQDTQLLILTNDPRAQIPTIPDLTITLLNSPIDPEEFLSAVARLLSKEVVRQK